MHLWERLVLSKGVTEGFLMYGFWPLTCKAHAPLRLLAFFSLSCTPRISALASLIGLITIYLLRGLQRNFSFTLKIRRCISERTTFYFFKGVLGDASPNSFFFKIKGVLEMHLRINLFFSFEYFGDVSPNQALYNQTQCGSTLIIMCVVQTSKNKPHSLQLLNIHS